MESDIELYMRRIGVATFARSEYSSFLPLLRAIDQDPELELQLLVSGMHLVPAFGETIRQIRQDGFRIDGEIDMLLASDSPSAVAKSTGLATMGFADYWSRNPPDILVLNGDRFELLGVVTAALNLRIPIAHISGGDVTEGALDNQVRHAVTKLSHLHFVSMEEHARRVIQMGEEAWRVFVTGDPALDLMREMSLLTRSQLEQELGMKLEPPVLLITYHPTTLGETRAVNEISLLLSALENTRGTMILTYPNADAAHHQIVEQIERFAAEREHARCFKSLGPLRYYSAMAHANLMIGNSSSGIWEAPSFRLPVINIGERQRGRLRAGNVIDVPLAKDSIECAVERGLDPAFHATLAKITNPYGDGFAAPRIVQALKQVELNARLLQKRFVDIPYEIA